MSKDARTLACAYYAAAGRCLEEDMAALASHGQGLLLYSPRLVVLMRSVSRHDGEPWLHLAAPQAEADAWYIHLLVGDVQLAQSLGALLEPLPWLCFQRGLRHPGLHLRPWGRFLRLLKHQHTHHTPIMGFSKPKISQPETVETPPPVVSETISEDTQQAYAQENSRKRGLLSTVLSSRKQGELVAPSNYNTTLG